MQMHRPVKRASKAIADGGSGVLVGVTPEQARWKLIRFGVRQIAAGTTWRGATGSDELCVVLLEGFCRVSSDSVHGTLGPRADVFTGYPHAVYLPPHTRFAITATARSIVADCRAPAEHGRDAAIIRPEDCGFEIRGGGNATRQIIDIMPPAFPAERLMICEVLTPSGNWSSYPPHKHDRNDLPREAQLEEIYYYRFRNTDGYGIQRLYTADGRHDQAITVRHGDLVIIRRGYHPFVAAHGYDAYYLNVLAGSHRSMAASDDPRYAPLRKAWPAADPRLPLIEHPAGSMKTQSCE
jgi:5-deoxy-glucuronate isomerase